MKQVGTWPLQDAKARLSEVVRAAQADGPQAISVRGRPAVVVVSSRDYRRLTARKESFVDFIRQSPLAGVDLPIERNRSITRDVNL